MKAYGEAFHRPAESIDNVIRRIVICNAHLSPKTIRISCFHKGHTHLYRGKYYSYLDRDIQETYEQYLVESNTRNTMDSGIESVFTSTLKKQCPECQKAFYHTALFNMPFMTHCPIHDEKLLLDCSKCGKKWSVGSATHTKECELCGLKFKFDDLARAHERFNSEQIAPLLELQEAILSFDYSSVMLLACITRFAKVRKTDILYDKSFGALLLDKFPSLCSILKRSTKHLHPVETVSYEKPKKLGRLRKIKDKYSLSYRQTKKYSALDFEYYNAGKAIEFYSFDQPKLKAKKLIVDSRLLALKHIFRAIMQYHPSEYGPYPGGITRYCPGGFEDPYAVSLGTWIRINFDDTRYLHHMYDRYYNGMFGEVSAAYTPKRVEPYQYLIENSCIYELPYEVAKQIYANDLIHSFCLLYEYISSVITDAHELGENKILFDKARSIEKVGLCNKPGSNALVSLEEEKLIIKTPTNYKPENLHLKPYKYME